MQVRLDKYLASLQIVSRRHVGKFVSSGAVCVDGEVVYKSDMKLSYGQVINVAGEDIQVKENVYVLLHKPSGYVCSELDEGGHLSYKVLLEDCVYSPILHVAGRLDHDTEGLVLCSSDGQFTHTIISPKKHLEKEYFVRTKYEFTSSMAEALSKGIAFLPGYPGGGRDDGYVTLPAKVLYVDKNGQECEYDNADRDQYALRLIITEGKYHQVKRMLLAVENEVTYLRRDRVGSWTLTGLEKGKWKEIDI